MMRHKVLYSSLSRKCGHKKSLFRNMGKSLFRHGLITTTNAKAKVFKSLVSRFITRLLKQPDDRSAVRYIKMVICGSNRVDILNILKFYKDNTGMQKNKSNFIRHRKEYKRLRDGAVMTSISLI